MNKLERKEYNKQYAQKNKEAINKRRRLHYADNKEIFTERAKEWRKQHPEQAKIIARRKYIKNRDKILNHVREYRNTHKEEIRERNKRYRENNKEALNVAYANKRARRRSAIGSHSADEWKELKESYLQMCVYCNNKFDKLDRDHIIPLIHGGTNYIDNIVPACTSCNSKKNSKSLLLFMLQEVSA